MTIGVVKWFSVEKGYGFIEPKNTDATKKDVFVHLTAVERSGLEELKKGQLLNFDVTFDERKGKNTAGNITLVNPPKH